tara:strand:+ start:107 stop:340 length:234 start_codon:yes stop_codon:yes gene_type:complete
MSDNENREKLRQAIQKKKEDREGIHSKAVKEQREKTYLTEQSERCQEEKRLKAEKRRNKRIRQRDNKKRQQECVSEQ